MLNSTQNESNRSDFYLEGQSFRALALAKDDFIELTNRPEAPGTTGYTSTATELAVTDIWRQ